MTSIEVQGLRRFYGSFEALKGIDFAVEKGSVFGFLGPNGAGKTTALYVLVGLLNPNGGRVSVLGLDPARQGDVLRSKIGCLLEDPGLYDTLTVEQNLSFYGYAQLMPEKDIKDRIDELLKFFELTDYKKKRAGTLSRGMRQKTALARALLARPEILFLDEPTANLDPQASVHFRDLVLELARKYGITVFLNTHRLDEAQRICDSVAIIKTGKVVASGTVDQLRSQVKGITLRVKSPDFKGDAKAVADLGVPAKVEGDLATIQLDNLDLIPSIVKKLVDSGFNLYEVVPDKLSLEEIFMEIVEENHASA